MINREEAKKKLKELSDEEIMTKQMRAMDPGYEPIDTGRQKRKLPTLSQLDGDDFD